MKKPLLPLSAQELTWAKALKRAVRRSDQRLTVTDWDILQHALVAKDNLGKALTRMRHLQALQELYGIPTLSSCRGGCDDDDDDDDDYTTGSSSSSAGIEEAKRDLQTFLKTHPGLYLSLAEQQRQPAGAETTTKDESDADADADDHDVIDPSSRQQQQHHQQQQHQQQQSPKQQIFCSAYQNFNASLVPSSEALAVYMRAAYYVLQASQYNLNAIRAGMILVMDLQGVGAALLRSRRTSLQTERAVRHLYVQAYPIRMKKVLLWRAAAPWRWAYRLMMRPWLTSPKTRNLVEFINPSSTTTTTTTTVEKDNVMLTTTTTTTNTSMEDSFAANSALDPAALPQTWGGDIPADDFLQTILNRLEERHRHVANFCLDDY